MRIYAADTHNGITITSGFMYDGKIMADTLGELSFTGEYETLRGWSDVSVAVYKDKQNGMHTFYVPADLQMAMHQEGVE